MADRRIKITGKQKLEIKRLHKSGMLQIDISRRYGISQAQVSRLLKKKN